MNKYVLASLLLGLPLLASAQPDIASPATTNAVVLVPSVGSFFVALVAGLILAVAFQLILTNLSVAAGLNILGSVTAPDTDKSKDKHDSSDTSVAGTVKKMNTAFGIWALATASITLFFASWLAVGLSLTASATIGAIIGLVIWGLFYTVMLTVETSALSSLVGSLGRMAISGLRTAYEGVSSIFSKSEESKAADTAAKITAAVREELFGDVDMGDVTKQIQKYINQLAPQKLDIKQIRQELAKLLDDTEIRAVSSSDGSILDTEMLVANLKNRGMHEGTARSVVNGVQQALGTFKEEKSTSKDTVSKVVDTGLRVAAGMSPSEAETARTKIEQYLRETGKEELNPEGIKRDIEKLFSNRREGMAALKDRISHIDKSTAVAVLTQRSDMTEEEAQRIVDQVERVLNQVSTTVTSGTSDLKNTVTEKIKNYLNSLDRPELNYEGLQSDMETLFNDPKAGGEALLRRLKSVNRDTLKALLASRDDMSEEDAERVISRIEAARDNVIGKVEQMSTEVKRRLEMAKDEALHQADEARKIAATAAWWAFASAVVSGIAAVLGGIVAAMTI
jgi:hypothetical protein